MERNESLKALLISILGGSLKLTLVENPKDAIVKVGDLMEDLEKSLNTLNTSDCVYPLEVIWRAISKKRTKIRETANYFRTLVQDFKEFQGMAHKMEATPLAENMKIARESGCGLYMTTRYGVTVLKKAVELEFKLSTISASINQHETARLDFIAMNCIIAVIDMDEILNGSIVTDFSFSDN
jgi:hypothetical protein